jgi:hypothetical protein
MGKGRWIRGMANGEWVKGMDSALSTARAARLRLRRNRAVSVRGRYGTRATSGNFHLFLTLAFWIGSGAPTGHSSRNSQTSVWIVSFVSF